MFDFSSGEFRPQGQTERQFALLSVSIRSCRFAWGLHIYIYTVIYPIGSMYGIYANIGCILMVNVTIYGIHGSYGYMCIFYIWISWDIMNLP